MTFDNNQISTILLLVETSQLQEPELSEAWALLKHIQDSKMVKSLLDQCIASGQLSAAQIEAHRVSDAAPKFEIIGVNTEFVPLALEATAYKDLSAWFQGPLPEIGDECSYVCIGRTPTSISMAFVTRQHLEQLRIKK